MPSGLLGSTALEVAIGLSFVYLLLALVCTSVNEWLAGLLKARSKLLKQAIQQLLAGQPSGGEAPGSFLDEFYRHPLVKSMMWDDRHPSYLSARTFAAVVTDLVSRRDPQPIREPPPRDPGEARRASLAKVDRSLGALAEGQVKHAVRALLPPEGGDFATLHQNLEGWFDDAMDRTSGWYKRRTQVWTVCVALLITVLTNADTLRIARHLWVDPALRESVVEEAKVRAREPRPSMEVQYKDPNNPLKPTITRRDGDAVHDREQKLLGELIGWKGDELQAAHAAEWPLRLLGWFISCVAISLGAPFWFDVLNKFINIRSAGKSPDETAKKPEKRQLPPADKAA